MKKISNANLKKIYPKRPKLGRIKTSFYLHNGELIEKYTWFYYLFLFLLLPLKIVLYILAEAYLALLEIKLEDFDRTKKTFDVSESHIETLLKE